MSCPCIKNVFNFHIEQVDNYVLFQDLSEWTEVPSSYSLSVTPPATDKSFKVDIDLKRLNKIDTSKDGVYSFKTESCGVTYTRSVALFPKIECCVSQLWATDSRHDKIIEIENHLKLISIHSERGNLNLAKSELEIAKKKLENLNCDCDCL